MSEVNLLESRIHHLDSLGLTNVGSDTEGFLSTLQGPTRVKILGKDSSRCRVLVTLLHGNEPSGLIALLQILSEGIQPAVDIYCYLIAIEAASLPPLFSHRQVPGKRDYNRCFSPPFEVDEQGQVCRALLQEIDQLHPEAVVDMHNTSGEGPSFGITTTYDDKHDDIVSLFTDRLIVTDLKLGAIMESNTNQTPIVTIECGGAFEETAHRVAILGLQRFFTVDRLFTAPSKDYAIELFFNPLRVEIHEAATLGYGDYPKPGIDITLKTDIEHHNFGRVTPSTLLGWLGDGALKKLAAFDAGRADHFETYYREENGGLYPKTSQRLFMITPNPEIAVSDCLWYVVADK